MCIDMHSCSLENCSTLLTSFPSLKKSTRDLYGHVFTCAVKMTVSTRVCFIQYMVASDEKGIITFTLNPIPKLYNCPNCKTVFSVIAVLFYHVVGEKTIYKLKSCYKNQFGFYPNCFFLVK